MRVNRALAAGLAAALAFAGTTAADEDGTTRLFRVWLKEGVIEDPHSESVDGHPCGGVSYRRAAAVPVEDAYIAPEIVREYDEVGAPIREWRVPVDTSVYAVSGDSILVSDNFESLWIDTSGRARAAPLTHVGRGVAGPHNCPMDSCVVFADLDDDRPRRLGYSSICS